MSAERHVNVVTRVLCVAIAIPLWFAGYLGVLVAFSDGTGLSDVSWQLMAAQASACVVGTLLLVAGLLLATSCGRPVLVSEDRLARPVREASDALFGMVCALSLVFLVRVLLPSSKAELVETFLILLLCQEVGLYAAVMHVLVAVYRETPAAGVVWTLEPMPDQPGLRQESFFV